MKLPCGLTVSNKPYCADGGIGKRGITHNSRQICSFYYGVFSVLFSFFKITLWKSGIVETETALNTYGSALKYYPF